MLKTVEEMSLFLYWNKIKKIDPVKFATSIYSIPKLKRLKCNIGYVKEEAILALKKVLSKKKNSRVKIDIDGETVAYA